MDVPTADSAALAHPSFRDYLAPILVGTMLAGLLLAFLYSTDEPLWVFQYKQRQWKQRIVSEPELVTPALQWVVNAGIGDLLQAECHLRDGTCPDTVTGVREAPGLFVWPVNSAGEPWPLRRLNRDSARITRDELVLRSEPHMDRHQWYWLDCVRDHPGAQVLFSGQPGTWLVPASRGPTTARPATYDPRLPALMRFFDSLVVPAEMSNRETGSLPAMQQLCGFALVRETWDSLDPPVTELRWYTGYGHAPGGHFMTAVTGGVEIASTGIWTPIGGLSSMRSTIGLDDPALIWINRADIPISDEEASE